MPLPESGLDGMNVVVRGHFNPGIFSPAWLLAQAIIGPSEYADAEPNIITRDFASFRTGWLLCDVTADALQLRTTDLDEFERVRDVVVAVLRTLHHTPVGALGINREIHFPVRDLEAWHAVGDALAPKAVWENVLIAAGMRNITLWGVRPDDYMGRVQVQVEPSLRVPRAIYVSVNDHFGLHKRPPGFQETRNAAWEVTSEDNVEPTPDKLQVALDILLNDWATSLARAETVIECVARQAGQK